MHNDAHDQVLVVSQHLGCYMNCEVEFHLPKFRDAISVVVGKGVSTSFLLDAGFAKIQRCHLSTRMSSDFCVVGCEHSTYVTI